ncbi:MAG: hypothetical protein IH969_09240 [Candidatus Krumholzibacteriota bacterium]|nr:hypothetical protein [Candidatus Krumholzibacteriota bacterium]
MDKILTYARKGGQLRTRKNDPVISSLARVLSPQLSSREREFYGRTLRDAGEATVSVAPGRQALLANLLISELDPETGIDRTAVRALAKAASATAGGDERLAEWLRKADRIEALMAPSEAAFELLITRDGQHPKAVAQELKDIWGTSVPYVGDGLDPLIPEMESSVGPEITAIMTSADESLAVGDYNTFVDCLLDWNRLVMESRGAAPWASLGSNGHLDVRYGGQERVMPDGDELTTYWRNPYFLDSLWSIALEIETGEV